MRLCKVNDSEKYWSDIENLIDKDGSKLKNAISSVASNSFQFKFDPFEGMRKIVQSHLTVNDPDVLGVKNFFFETFARLIIEGSEATKIAKNMREVNSDFAMFEKTYNKILHKAFIPIGKEFELATYREFLRSINIDTEYMEKRITEQKAYSKFLVDLLIKEGKVDIENGARAVVDVYWRMCELCYPLLNVARSAIQTIEGKKDNSSQPSFDKLIEDLQNHCDGAKLVRCVEPALRHSEAHCSTSVIVQNGKPIVLLYESRGTRPHEICRMQFSEVEQKAKCLLNSLLPALYTTLVLFEYSLNILTLNSYEFKLRLVTLGQN